MTSFLIDAQNNRSVHPSWKQSPSCPFCRIIRGELPAYRVYENDKVVAILGFTLNLESFFHAYDGWIDILPLRQGHTLVIPKTHFSRLSELPAEFAAAAGEAVTRVAHALTHGALNCTCTPSGHVWSLGKVLQNTGLNVVGNQEYAQAVHHVLSFSYHHFYIYGSILWQVHYHIIPAPTLNSSSSPVRTFEDKSKKDPRIPLTSKEMHRLEFESRTELDDKDAEVLVQKIRARL
jgi:diadenosine tetraphosphate (Ap4A) HIT family hydrolase